MQLSEDESEEIVKLAKKLKDSTTRLNLHLDFDQHELYITCFRQVMQDLPNVAIFVWKYVGCEDDIWSCTRYCQGNETVNTNLREIQDPDFAAF
ncbi:MAG: hypothetical protein LLG04_08455 [Parachlamydia sp.]|nr:hypothetical protein [Parachlamydia sp.]